MVCMPSLMLSAARHSHNHDQAAHCGDERGGEWSSPQVMRILERLDLFREEEAAAA
jgi:hypothetical protein